MGLEILKDASSAQIEEAVIWTAGRLGVPESCVTSEVAVAYIVRHFELGNLSGWGGFTETIEE